MRSASLFRNIRLTVGSGGDDGDDGVVMAPNGHCRSTTDADKASVVVTSSSLSIQSKQRGKQMWVNGRARKKWSVCRVRNIG